MSEFSVQLSRAFFSDDRRYRYSLYRDLGVGHGTCVFICLNPSTADETKNDPTVRRCMNYAKGWGYRYFYMLNLYAYRATLPKDMMAQGVDAIGPDNKEWLQTFVNFDLSTLIIAAWGNHGNVHGMADYVRGLARESGHRLYCLKVTKSGQPNHPLYLSKGLKPIEYI